jgi:homospermidine synthase
MKIAKPYLGPFVSKPVDWTPLRNYDKTFRTLGLKKPKNKDVWQFTTFLVSQS